MLINSTKRKISLNKNPRIVNKYFLNFSKQLCNTQYVSEIMSNKLFALTKHTHFFLFNLYTFHTKKLIERHEEEIYSNNFFTKGNRKLQTTEVQVNYHEK